MRLTAPIIELTFSGSTAKYFGYPENQRTTVKAKMYGGKPLGNVPKEYTLIGLSSHNIGGGYNSTTLTLFEHKHNYKGYTEMKIEIEIYYEIYRDGCFYPYYGMIEIIK